MKLQKPIKAPVEKQKDDLANEELIKKCIEAGRPKHLVDQVILKNKNLIPFVINNFAQTKLLRRAKHLRDDLEQEGIFGLMEAIKRFDLSKGTKFSTYATWWVLQACTDYVSKNFGLIKLPSHVRSSLSALQKQNLDADLRNAITETDDLTKKKKSTLLAAVQAQKTSTVFDIEQEHSKVCTPEQNFDSNEVLNVMKKNLESLTDIERIIICMRYDVDFVNLETLTKEGKRKI